jgi:hypothetical protein
MVSIQFSYVFPMFVARFSHVFLLFWSPIGAQNPLHRAPPRCWTVPARAHGTTAPCAAWGRGEATSSSDLGEGVDWGHNWDFNGGVHGDAQPIGSMYGIYGNIYHIMGCIYALLWDS